MHTVNSAQNILVVLESLGKVECTLELQSHNYAIISLPILETHQFQHSSNIRQVAQAHGLGKYSLVPEIEGFYLVVNANLVSEGRSMLELTIIDIRTDTIYYVWYFEHYSLVDVDAIGCFPVIEQPSW